MTQKAMMYLTFGWLVFAVVPLGFLTNYYLAKVIKKDNPNAGLKSFIFPGSPEFKKSPSALKIHTKLLWANCFAITFFIFLLFVADKFTK
jgi:hypothetical protein